jgi:hypothetical protein
VPTYFDQFASLSLSASLAAMPNGVRYLKLGAQRLFYPLKRAIKNHAVLRPNEKEISHGRVSWQKHWAYFAMVPLASSIYFLPQRGSLR